MLDVMRWRFLTVAGCVLAACDAAGPTPIQPAPVPTPSPSAPHISEFTWRNATPTMACFNLLTGSDFASIRCSAEDQMPVRITITDISGDCGSSPLPYGTRCKTIDGMRTAQGNWEAPWGLGRTETAMTVTVTCAALDARGDIADVRTTCIPSTGYSRGSGIVPPPWSAACQAQLLPCHMAP